MSRFNLVDEKWIPVRFPDGTRDELGIYDTLLRSKEIAAIEDHSPLVVASLHRFLLAVLYRSLEGPTDIDQAKALFRDGLPIDRIAAYLEKWRTRFWLFDETYPFGQNPNIPEREIEPWTKLTAEFNATTNKVLFDHTDTKKPGSRGPKECTRWLLSTLTFSISGGRGYYPSPSSNAMMCIPLGTNLHQTLCYCLVPYSNREVMKADSVLWEREPIALPIEKPKRMATGYADLYTWQSRMIRLEELPSAEVAVMRFVAGNGFEDLSGSSDPMLPYKVDKKFGKLPVQFREDRGTWRDFDSLLPDSSELAPLTIQNSIRLTTGKMESVPNSVLVLGLRYKPPNANVDFWRMERFTLPKALTGDRSIRTEIRQLLTDAEDAQGSLWNACLSFAKNMLSRGGKDPAKKDIRNFIEQMPVNSLYWSALESRFHEVLGEYNLSSDPDNIRRGWLKNIRAILREAWEQQRNSVSMGNAYAIRAFVKADRPVLSKLRHLIEEIEKLETK